MMMKYMAPVVSAVMLASASAVEWMTDMEAAKAKAAAEHKAVLVDFTGSDWCGACIRLRKISLDTPQFEEYARDKFVCLEVDVPKVPKFSAEQMERNRALVKQYAVVSFPTVLVLTPQGVVVGGFGGNADIRETQEWLDKALAAAKVLENAEGCAPEHQREALQKVLKGLHPGIAHNAATLEAEISRLDPQDQSGLAHKKQVEEQARELVERSTAAMQAPEGARGALKLLEELSAGILPENRLLFISLKVNAVAAACPEREEFAAQREKILAELDGVKPATEDDSAQVERLKASLNEMAETMGGPLP